jgi:polysaccharide export outer membrane protein
LYLNIFDKLRVQVLNNRSVIMRLATAALAMMFFGDHAEASGRSSLVQGKNAYEVVPAAAGDGSIPEYRIGPADALDITVFQESDISVKGVPVDASGDISMPLIGRVHASGQSTVEFAEVVAQKLGERYYVDPQVTVSVASSVSQRITVQGQVTEPGIYPMRGMTTLLDAVAMAKGETENGALRRVAVVRMQDGKRVAAIFDLNRIRRGEDLDPQLIPRDVVIVGHSTSKQLWHDLLRAAPLLNIFTRY